MITVINNNVDLHKQIAIKDHITFLSKCNGSLYPITYNIEKIDRSNKYTIISISFADADLQGEDALIEIKDKDNKTTTPYEKITTDSGRKTIQQRSLNSKFLNNLFLNFRRTKESSDIIENQKKIENDSLHFKNIIDIDNIYSQHGITFNRHGCTFEETLCESGIDTAVDKMLEVLIRNNIDISSLK